jgi:beta-galactosidase
MVHVLPHWNWAGREGQAIPVMAYTNAEEVELLLNGRSLGRKRKGDPYVMPVGKRVSDDLTFTTSYRLVWEVPFEPGTLKAVARSGGAVVATTEARTAGAPARLALRADRTGLSADGEDLSFITVRVEDAEGTLVPDASNLVRVSVEGAGRIAGVDNGNPASLESVQAHERKAFSGLALVIVRTKRDDPGSIRVSAASDGLAPAAVTLTASPSPGSYGLHR